jgi:diguanylate cyclase (GGDEF)-like protein/PAS domain S-box-containing protein
MHRWLSLPRSVSPIPLLIVFVLIVGSAIFAIVFLHNWTERQQELARAESNITNLSYSLAQHASRTIEEADLLISEVVERVEHGGLSAYQRERLNRHLTDRVGAVPPIQELSVLDEFGGWVATSLPHLPTFSISDHEYFLYHKTHVDRSMRINAPILSRVTGRWSILVTRRVDNPDGSFGGIVAATIDTSYFLRFYESFDIGEHGTIALILRDGRLLVRRPFDPAFFGKDMSNLPFFRDGQADQSSGFLTVVSPFDGVRRLGGFKRLPEFPVLVWVALEENEVLAQWRESLKSDASVAAACVGLIMAFGAFTILHLRRKQQLEKAMIESEQRFRLLADNAADMVVVLDFDGTRRYVSPPVIDLLGYTPEEFVASNVFGITKPEHQIFLRSVFELMRDGAERQRLEYELRRKDGSYVWVEATFKHFHDENGAVTGLIAVVRDVSIRKAMEIELQDANTRLKTLAATDFLTGIANRRSFDVAIEQESRRSQRSGAPLAALLIDVDHFKGYNDHFGHSHGDECLRQVAQAISRCTKRPGDLAARYGGEEFALILPETDEAGAHAVAECVRAEVAALRLEHPDSKHDVVTVSIGVAAAVPQDEEAPRALLSMADMALYRAKALGRNCVVGWSQINAARSKAG